MEKRDCCNTKNDACAAIFGEDDKDDHKSTQQLIREYEDSIPGELIRSLLPRSAHDVESDEFDLAENLDSFTIGDRSSENVDSTINLSYEDMLDGFAELDLSNLHMDTNDVVATNELTPSLGNRVSRLNEKIAQNLLQCRDLTVEAEAVLLEKLDLERNLENVLQSINNARTGSQACSRHSTIIRLHSSHFHRFGIPYFRTTARYTPGPNVDTKEIVGNDEIMVIRLPRFKMFKRGDKCRLEAAVLKQLKIERVRRLRATLAAKNNITRKHSDDVCKEIKYTQSVRTIRSTKGWNIPVDFSKLFANPESTLDFRFNEDECERIWRLVGDPKISKEEFSATEANRLEQLTREYGAQNWDRIASTLNAGGNGGQLRSGFVCFVKWARLRRLSACHQLWSKEESDRLASLCRKLEYTEDRIVITDTWRHIRRQFPHRTYAQLNYRWLYVLKPSLKKGRFTKKEINVLNHLKDEGKSYREIASVVQTRSSVQLRTHYNAVSMHALYNRGPWTTEEEAKFASLVRRYGAGNWTKISRRLGTRSRTQCRLKMQTLNCIYWSAVEKQKFRSLIKKYGINFEKISQEIGTKNARQCQYMYKVKMGVSANHFWSASEKALFRTLLEKWKDNFERISRELGTRTVKHCRRMYQRMLQRGEIEAIKLEPNTNSSRWSDEETKLLSILAGKWKGNFKAMSRELGTKSADQCRYKYSKMRYRSPRQKTGPWSSEETELFLTLVSKWERNFASISREMRTRNTEQCRLKYYRMLESGHITASNAKLESSRKNDERLPLQSAVSMNLRSRKRRGG